MRKLTVRAEVNTTQPHPPSGGIIFVLPLTFLVVLVVVIAADTAAVLLVITGNRLDRVLSLCFVNEIGQLEGVGK